MTSGYKIADKEGLYFLTFQIVGWVDIFTRKIYRDIVIESFEYCQKHKGFELFAYVIYVKQYKPKVQPENISST